MALFYSINIFLKTLNIYHWTCVFLSFVKRSCLFFSFRHCLGLFLFLCLPKINKIYSEYEKEHVFIEFIKITKKEHFELDIYTYLRIADNIKIALITNNNTDIPSLMEEWACMGRPTNICYVQNKIYKIKS